MKKPGGIPEKAMSRPVITVSVSDNLTDFVEALGFGFESEHVREGWAYVSSGGIETSVSRVYRPTERGDPSSRELFSPGHFVEASAIATTGKTQEVGVNLATFAEQLRPLVGLSKE